MIKLCECGCGKATKLARQSNSAYGWVRGEPLRFLHGHSGRRGQDSTHGMSHTRVYRLWGAMIQRCTNPHSRGYKDYGARGIRPCKAWFSFEAFLADMGEPAACLTLERLDNNKGYSKFNCVWADRRTQQRNRRVNRWYVFKGERVLLSDLAKAEGIPLSTLYKRVNAAGMTVEAAVAHKLHARAV